MKISAQKLRQIVVEELDRITTENETIGLEVVEEDPLVPIIAQLEMVAKQIMDLGNQEAFDLLVGALDGMKELSTSPGNAVIMAKSELAEEKPSAGLSKKQKSAIAKKSAKGGDVGKKGKNFDKVASKAAKKYGSKEAGERVAAAAMWKNAKR
jgi:hypothetical protein